MESYDLKRKRYFVGLLILFLLLFIITELFYRKPLFDKSCEWIKYIQKNSSSKGWDDFWYIITIVGTQAVLLPMFFIIYLFKSLKHSYLFLSVLALSVFLDNLMKNIYANPRPYMIDREIIIKHCDAGYGNPSGHSFSSTVSYLAFFHLMTDVPWFKKNWTNLIVKGILLGLTIILVLAIMFSRFYLGVHTLNQLMYGCLCGFSLYFFYFYFLAFHKYTNGEFFNLFYKLNFRIIHSIMFVAFIVLNFGLYFFNTHDTSDWNKLIEEKCPEVPIYRRFDNDAGINSLTIFAMIGAYIGLAIVLSWRNNIDKEGESYEELNYWNTTNIKRFLLRLLVTLVLTAVSMSSYLLISKDGSLAIIIPFKIILSFLLVGMALFGLVIFISIKCNLANENFDIMEGGDFTKLHAEHNTA